LEHRPDSRAPCAGSRFFGARDIRHAVSRVLRALQKQAPPIPFDLVKRQRDAEFPRLAEDDAALF